MKTLNQSYRGDKRGEWDYKQFIHEMKILNQEILDLLPPSFRFKKKSTIKNSHHLCELYFRSHKGNPRFYDFMSILNHVISFLICP